MNENTINFKKAWEILEQMQNSYQIKDDKHYWLTDGHILFKCLEQSMEKHLTEWSFGTETIDNLISVVKNDLIPFFLSRFIYQTPDKVLRIFTTEDVRMYADNKYVSLFDLDEVNFYARPNEFTRNKINNEIYIYFREELIAILMPVLFENSESGLVDEFISLFSDVLQTKIELTKEVVNRAKKNFQSFKDRMKNRNSAENENEEEDIPF